MHKPEGPYDLVSEINKIIKSKLKINIRTTNTILFGTDFKLKIQLYVLLLFNRKKMKKIILINKLTA